MNGLSYPNRSVLHSLEPIGVGTPQIESLLSYFFRLAGSHCISGKDLIRKVNDKMDWKHSSADVLSLTSFRLNGVSDLTARWSHGLSELTGVEQLDKLTLLSWRDVIAAKGLTAAPSRWCSHCFAQDRTDGRTPYFRLAWDMVDVDVCPTHQTDLTDVCTDCGRTNIRNNLSYVVPGWCSSCGAFLGDGKGSVSSRSGDLWKSAQIGAMLAFHSTLQSQPNFITMMQGMRSLIARLDDGNIAAFARRIGLTLPTVHNWVSRGSRPAVACHLRIASQSGVALTKLLTGCVVDSPCRPTGAPELTTLFPASRKPPTRQTHDAKKITAQLAALNQLEIPISIREAERRLGIHNSMLRKYGPEETRIMGARWKQDKERRGIERKEKMRRAIEAALREILAEGKKPTWKLIKNRISMYSFELPLIKEAKAKIESEQQLST
ncbi:TniQ family protein [Paraburkholderia nemoris]|uniref:TniQ domain-containing protein n=1 Tax=Paraburkholderia nemoris TaxID=2793076 RepID=A0ABN7N2I5_9BURK|nr:MULTISPECIES: TniQ family protein [Paraburkholderia]MBK3815255.1 TniQ family protein [Paraburkholderia aspalathi]CAE6714784.1 hypothetical protein R75777_01296 [Paraburkholderia nemoris]CAE6840493.1 hypothetical protein R69776_07022 [Paraburkholderia nemoris]